MKASHHLHNVR